MYARLRFVYAVRDTESESEEESELESRSLRRELSEGTGVRGEEGGVGSGAGLEGGDGGKGTEAGVLQVLRLGATVVELETTTLVESEDESEVRSKAFSRSEEKDILER